VLAAKTAVATDPAATATSTVLTSLLSFSCLIW
jgi:hypothetical protein